MPKLTTTEIAARISTMPEFSNVEVPLILRIIEEAFEPYNERLQLALARGCATTGNVVYDAATQDCVNRIKKALSS